MAAFGSAEFVIRAVNQTQKAFAQIHAGVDNMDKRFSKLGNGLNRLGGLMATAFVGKQITDTITKFEKLEASLRTVTGSADNAAVAFGFIQEFAASTPFQLEEVTDAFIKLKALGLTPSEDALTSYGNTATAMGKSLNQMIEAVADATTGEFERLKEFGIRSKTQGDQVTFTFQGISTTVGKNAKEIEAYLQSIGNVQFAGAMQEQAGTLNVALSNMGDAFAKLVKAIGDAGLTDILMAIANGIKWLAEQITNAIEPFKLGFKAIIAEVVKFGRLFIAVFEGVGDAFNAFGDAISARFEALGKDLAAFVENPLGGVSFENTRAALETGLLDAMGTAFDKALQKAKDFNASIDAEIQDAALKIAEARDKKNQSLSSLFEETKTPETTKETNKETKQFNKLQQEAQRIIDAAISLNLSSFMSLVKISSLPSMRSINSPSSIFSKTGLKFSSVLAFAASRSLVHAYDVTDDEFNNRLCLLLNMADHAAKHYAGSGINEKRELLSFVFQNLTLKEKKLEYTMRYPFNLFADANKTGEWCTRQDSNL